MKIKIGYLQTFHQGITNSNNKIEMREQIRNHYQYASILRGGKEDLLLIIEHN